jgi:hypothetical protein
VAALPDNLETEAARKAGEARLGLEAGRQVIASADRANGRPAMQVSERQHEDVAVIEGVDQREREPVETAAARRADAKPQASGRCGPRRIAPQSETHCPGQALALCTSGVQVSGQFDRDHTHRSPFSNRAIAERAIRDPKEANKLSLRDPWRIAYLFKPLCALGLRVLFPPI